MPRGGSRKRSLEGRSLDVTSNTAVLYPADNTTVTSYDTATVVTSSSEQVTFRGNWLDDADVQARFIVETV